MNDSALRLRAAIRASVPLVTDVSIGRRGDSTTVKVQPPDQQEAAQAIINAFDWSDAADVAFEDNQRPERKNIRQAAANAISDNNTFLALASPTNAQVVAQVKRLSQECTAVIKRIVQLD